MCKDVKKQEQKREQHLLVEKKSQPKKAESSHAKENQVPVRRSNPSCEEKSPIFPQREVKKSFHGRKVQKFEEAMKKVVC